MYSGASDTVNSCSLKVNHKLIAKYATDRFCSVFILFGYDALSASCQTCKDGIRRSRGHK
jgi:hypothetical protein